MAASCEAWARSRYTGGVGPHRIHIGPARRALCEYIETNPTQELRTTWPIPIEGTNSEIWMVVRQRIELTDTDKDADQAARLAEVVKQHPKWLDAMQEIRGRSRPSPFGEEAYGPEEAAEYEFLPSQVVWDIASRVLAGFNLPVSPSAVEFAIKTALPDQPFSTAFRSHVVTGPKPSLLVESLFLIDTATAPLHGDVLSSISGSAFEANRALWHRAAAKVVQHREWWKNRVILINSDQRQFGSGFGVGLEETLRQDVCVHLDNPEQMTRTELLVREERRRAKLLADKAKSKRGSVESAVSTAINRERERRKKKTKISVTLKIQNSM